MDSKMRRPEPQHNSQTQQPKLSDRISDWLTGLHQSDAEGTFFIVFTGFTVVGYKPA
ncbi:hypothetical protein [Rubidibacter lacunae]|uniref:hypothetical protein n=1 Tax=Rubidibacter lacunae TaxID=582514 RepID=UPI0004018F22|nr:hypothetical protein [Rubidibacter lacunae]